ncbi:MAG: spore cortex biosynthesis protein YabQ [Lachnospiraceae bacterium]
MITISGSILHELNFFLSSIFLGGLLLFYYDVIKLVRRIVPHGKFLMGIEDVIFWMLAAVSIFSMVFQKNQGLIRGFSIMGIVVGMLVYHLSFSRLFVFLIKKVEEKIKKVLKKK